MYFILNPDEWFEPELLRTHPAIQPNVHKDYQVTRKLFNPDVQEAFLEKCEQLGLKKLKYYAEGKSTLVFEFASGKGQFFSLTIENQEWPEDDLFLQPIIGTSPIANGLYFEVRPEVTIFEKLLEKDNSYYPVYFSVEKYLQEAAKQRGIELRDLNPKNIGLLWDGTPVIVDKGCFYRKVSPVDIVISPPQIDFNGNRWDSLHEGKQATHIHRMGLEYGQIKGLLSASECVATNGYVNLVEALADKASLAAAKLD